MRAEEKLASLEKQLQEALWQLKEVTDLLRETQEHLQQAQLRIAELEKQKTPPPAFVKADKKKPKSEEIGAHAHCRTPDRRVSGLSSALRRHQSGSLP